MKVHLAVSDWPCNEGGYATAICGEPISKVAFKFMWDSDAIPDLSRNLIGMCKKCRETALPDKRYVYGVVSGQEARDQA